jgi:hypothetical protein
MFDNPLLAPSGGAPTRPLRLVAAVGAMSLLLAGAVGCAGDDVPTAAEPAPTTSTVRNSTAPEPLGLEEHVVSGDGLPGFVAQAEPVRQDLRAFAREHDKTVAELRRTGMVAGTSVMFDPAGAGEGFAMSVAAQFEAEGQATAEAQRLFAANSEPDEGTDVAPLAVPGVPGAQAVTLSGRQGGTSFTGVEIVFADGVVTHELFAFGEEPAFDPQALVASATALYERVTGRPLTEL